MLSYGEKRDAYFEDKSNAEFCIVFNSQGRERCTFYLSSFESAHFDQKWYPDLWRVRSKKSFINALYVEWVRSILVEYGETLVYKGLIVIWIFITTTSDTHNLFSRWSKTDDDVTIYPEKLA